jgi:hypothetical protein
VLAVVALAAELVDSESLTHGWKSAPKRVTIPIAVLVNAHLFGLLPPSLDPFTWSGRGLRALGLVRRPCVR